MEAVLTLKLLGSPTIYLDQEEIFFSFSKINALIYYLLINGTVSREEIAGILWENKNNQIAKKNLRNTVYQANKMLGGDYIISPNRAVLSLNPELKIESDVAIFSENPIGELSLYKGDFLQGFYLKDSESFELWMTKKRQQFEQIYIKACYQKVEQQINEADFEETEKNLRKLIDIDEFEEKNYQLLMKMYQENSRPSKVIETYYKLANILDKELGISPNKDIQQIYHEVVAKDRTERKAKQFLRNTNHFFGRATEIAQLESFFSKIIEEQEVRALVLVGEAGVGKRTVARQVLANQTQYFQIVTAECFKDEIGFPLQPWRSILESLGDLVIQNQIMTPDQWTTLSRDYFSNLNIENQTTSTKTSELHKLAEFIVDSLQSISKKQALVILIEECHWMDDESLFLLQTVINHLHHYPMAWVLTKNNDVSLSLENCLNHLIIQEKIDFISLHPLNKEESYRFVQKQLLHQPLSTEELDNIYDISQGNPFLLSEYVKAIEKGEKFTPLLPAIKARLSLRFADLTSQAQELIHYLSCFRGAASLKILSKLMLLPIEEISEIVEELCQKNFLLERFEDDELVALFSQNILQLYCYDVLSLAKKRILHNHIAQGMETLLRDKQQHSQLFNEIAYHYQMSNQPIKSLDYKLNYLNTILQFHHELFPIYSRKFGFIEKIDDDSQALIQQQFAHIREQINHLEQKYGNRKDFQLLRIRFLYLDGRYHIRIGNYQKGLSNIQKVIATSKELEQMDYLLEGYRQLIYYCIQVESISEMNYYTELALDASVQANNHVAIGTNLRLRGLYFLMVGDEEQAIQLINQSIDCFSLTPSLQSKYSIQIAAALDYLAEIEQIRGDFEAALKHQQHSIALTENKLDDSSIIVFYIGLGTSYYFLGDMQAAEEIFFKAKKEIQTLSFPWKEAQLEVYLALIHYQKGNYELVTDLLSRKESLIKRYNNPRDKGMIYYLMCTLKYAVITGKIKEEVFGELLHQKFAVYYEIAKYHLNPYRDRYQVEELEKMNQMLKRAPF
ncbi:MAG: AAA family ATPase [Streptococcus sp.]|nr:AAA family ATPase [Streptococcus sp.]